ncbi:23S rRNA (uracil(1939)-C(5))-methyltransferase RlmD [Eubacteriales bacterium KG127]
MRKGDIIKAQILDITQDGAGVAKGEDRVTFIYGATIGEVVEAEITQVKKKFAKANTIQVLEKSQFRKADEEVCPHIKEGCGGCNLGKVKYDKQLQLKESHVKNSLERIGGFKIDYPEISVETILPSSRINNYRNKAVFSVEDEKVGFLKAKSKVVVDCPNCKIQDKNIMAAAAGLRTFLNIYKQDAKYIKKFMVRTGDNGNVMAVIYGDIKSIHHMQQLVDCIYCEVDLVSIFVMDTGEKGKLEHVAGEKTLIKSIGNMNFEVGPDAFFQINEFQTGNLYRKAIDYANLSLSYRYSHINSNENFPDRNYIVDIYCGVGTIGLSMSSNENYIVGVEINKEACLNANRNAVINKIVDARFFNGPAEKILPRLINEGIMDFSLFSIDVAIIDPPRAGCERDLLECLGEINAKSIVYVSCDPATMARDMAHLRDKYGYKLTHVCPVDMFPESMNVETVALLSKLDVDKHIDVEIKLDELDLTSAESKATYAQIKKYILEKFDLKVSTLYIAQIKKKCGIALREHYNKSKKEKQVIPQCTPKKEEAIMDALRHFKMI